jgi:RNA polymerase sigma-70 factor, ECF subfamily
MHYGDEACGAERLMQLVRGGDPRALDQITRCYGDRLLAAGRSHCRTGDEADDAVQDALLTAATRLNQFRGEGSLEGWLVRIVARACRRISRGRKNDATLHDGEGELVASAASPEELTAERELAELIEGTLLALGPEDRAVLILSELEDWTATEVGAELGLSPGAVRTRLSRLRAGLRQALEPALTDSQ